MSRAGLASRRDAEEWVTQGRVAVNGRVINSPALDVTSRDVITVDGQPLPERERTRLFLYHKPRGLMTTHDDPEGRPTVFDNLPEGLPRLISIGRLDFNTEGLLLFTTSGDLANRLMHPSYGAEREYAVRVLGELDAAARDELLEGVQLGDGPARFLSLEEAGGEGANRWWRVVISEGRNREVRRLFEAVGHAVSRLIRIRYGAMLLPRGLKRGAWMELDEQDIRALMAAAGMQERPRAAQGQGAGRSRRAGAAPRGPGGAAGARKAQGASQNAPQRGRGQGGGAQPDPMKTSLGYIGADSLSRQRQGQKRNAPRRGGR